MIQLFCLLDSMHSKVNNSISYMELHIPTFHILHLHCTFNTHISNFEKLIVGTVGTVSSKRLFVPFHLCPSNIKGLHLVHCLHGSAFSNISCLTFVHYCLPFIVLFVTFNSKESKFAPTPNLHYL